MLHLAYQLDTLPTELSLPKVVVFMTGTGFGKSAWEVVRPNGWGPGVAYAPVRCRGKTPWGVSGGEAPPAKMKLDTLETNSCLSLTVKNKKKMRKKVFFCFPFFLSKFLTNLSLEIIIRT